MRTVIRTLELRRRVAKVMGLASLLAFASTGFSAAHDRHVLDFGDRVVRGDTQIGIKKEARDRGIVLRDNQLIQVLLVAKSRGGAASARLLDGGSRAEVTVPGTPEKFDDDQAYTFSRLSIDAGNMDGTSPWRLILRGQIKIRQIILIASKDEATIPIQLDFGGMFGMGTQNQRTVNYNNPLTGSLSCPAGFSTIQVSGVMNTDYSSYYCVRPFVAGQAPTLLFGGMFGGGEGSTQRYVNPVTGASSCPAGYKKQDIRGAYDVDWNQAFCYKVPTNRNEKSATPFAGLIGTRPNGSGGTAYYVNPITGNSQCPAGYRAHKIYGTNNVDWGMSLCVLN